MKQIVIVSQSCIMTHDDDDDDDDEDERSGKLNERRVFCLTVSPADDRLSLTSRHSHHTDIRYLTAVTATTALISFSRFSTS